MQGLHEALAVGSGSPHYHLALLFDEMIQNNVHTAGEGHFRCMNRVKDRHTQTGAWSSERLIAIPKHP